MLTENDVVAAACRHLQAQGFTIESSCSTTERGTDVVARNARTGQTVLVEAKGATSSGMTARAGKPFNGAQVFSHVARALLKAAKLLQREDGDVNVAIALPDTPLHRRNVNEASRAFEVLRIAVWFVNDRGELTVL